MEMMLDEKSVTFALRLFGWVAGNLAETSFGDFNFFFFHAPDFVFYFLAIFVSEN